MFDLFLACLQVLRGGFQTVTLKVDLTHSHVHVCRSPHGGVAVLRRKLQGVLVGTQRLAETALRDPYFGQSDGAPDRIGDVPCLL